MSTDLAGNPALATLRRARAQQEAALRWTRRLAPPLFVVVVAVTFSSGRNPGIPGRDVVAVLAVGGFALGALGALTARYRRVAVRIVFAVVLVASSALLMALQPDGPGLAGLLAGLVLLAPRVPDRFPVALSIVGITCLAAVAVAFSHDSPTLALLSAIAIVGFPGMTLLARRLGQANDQAERLLIELEGTRAAQARAAGLAERQRLAREMHDVLAHSLSGLMLQLEGAGCSRPMTPAIPGCRESSSGPTTWASPGSTRPAGRSGCSATTNCPGPSAWLNCSPTSFSWICACPAAMASRPPACWVSAYRRPRSSYLPPTRMTVP
jgi:hypothetical protein